ncbi:universal stress protein [Brevibacterium sp. GP-SGM9]|uniref:universal stress protein n=1 Tax=Brevibacterium sp. GP-SGM9 TaxID=3376990 RepID=UPI0039A5CA6F
MTIIAAFPYGKRDRSALHLAATLARSNGEAVRIVSIVPAQSRSFIASGSDLQLAAWSRERGRKAVAEAERAAADICPDVETEAVAVQARSRGKGLIAEAVDHDASMIVLGSGTEGARGRIRVSGTSDRLLHSSPVPVALAPKGYQSAPGSVIGRVTCSFRGDERSQRVLAQTAELSESVEARLRVATFGVSGRTVEPVWVEENSRRADYVRRVKAAQAAAIEGVDEIDIGEAGTPVEEAVGIGKDWKSALSALDWGVGEVLVLGSSADGPKSRVFLGSNAAKIIRHAPVPVVVVP